MSWVCKCGKTFEKKTQYNGHISICKEFLGEEKYLEYLNRRKNKLKKAKENIRIQKEKQKSREVHICERCGKEFIGNASKYSTNRFCSRSCANKHENRSEESRRKTSDSLKKNKNRRTLRNNPTEKQIEAYKNRKTSKKFKLESEYLLDPNYCRVCGKVMPYEKRYRVCCSDICRKERSRQSALENEKFIFSTKSNRYKKGYYKGFWCDSSYELAYVIYCLDHNIKIERNKKGFPYRYKCGNIYKIRKYYPDFRVNGKLVEIKGRKTELVSIKAQAVTEPLDILYKEDLKKVFDYVEKNYNKKQNKFYELYDGYIKKKE